MQALGLIEVIGYPPAVEAADAALKAANVTLLSIAKADAGIMTVEIIGDVGAVTAAVDAGARSAARIGLVRARHVISRVESDLIGKVIPSERAHQETENNPQVVANEELQVDEKPIADEEPQAYVEPKSDMEESIALEDMHEPVTEEILVDKPSVSEGIEKEEEKSPIVDFSQEQLSKRSNANLRNLIRSLDIQVTTERLNTMKKQDLIRLLLEYSKEHGK
nr:BMC domain-containing protein [uncultured Anaerosporobacter sp.]